VEAVTNTLGAEVTGDAHSFDAFGKPRARDLQVQDKLHLNGDFGATTEHGFTGHEHLDDTYLIHMNGRVYDYRLGRFLSVDPVISTSGSQSLNPYSYVVNNPLAGRDPTGYECSGDSSTGTHICASDASKTLTKVGNDIKNALAQGVVKETDPVASVSRVLGYDAEKVVAMASGNGAQGLSNTTQKGATDQTQNPAQNASQPQSAVPNGNATDKQGDDPPRFILHHWKNRNDGTVAVTMFRERIIDSSNESNPDTAADELEKLVRRTGERMRDANPKSESETYLFELRGGGHGSGIAQTLNDDTKVYAAIAFGWIPFLSVHNHTSNSAEGMMSLTDISTANKTGIDAVMYQLDGRMYYYRANSISNNDAMTRNRENDGKGISVEEWHK
jgi:RHS repeat-associated protein